MASPSIENSTHPKEVTFSGQIPTSFIDDGQNDGREYIESRDLSVKVDRSGFEGFYLRYRPRVDELFIEWVNQHQLDPRFLWNHAGELYDNIMVDGTDYEVFMMSGTQRRHFQHLVWLYAEEKLQIIDPKNNEIDKIRKGVDEAALVSAIIEYGLNEAPESSERMVPVTRGIGSLSLSK